MTPSLGFRRQSIAHEDHRHVAMPLGGIGTGNVALAADGSLRQWQLHNIANHVGTLPGSFFSIRVTRIEPPMNEIRVLQGVLPAEGQPRTPLVNDDDVPGWQRDLLSRHGGIAHARFSGTYPFAHVEFQDDAIPLDMSLEAFTPLVPFDVEKSSLPVAMLTFTVRNIDSLPLHGTLGGTLQNAVGWDGISPIDGVRGAGYGGNTNRVLREGHWTSIVMENSSLSPQSAAAGQMVLAADSASAAVLPNFRSSDEFLAFLQARALNSGAERIRTAQGVADPQKHAPQYSAAASPAGETVNGGIGVPFSLEPGEETTIRFAIVWHFPNRYVNFEQFGPERPEWGATQFWLGNAYSTRFANAERVLDRVTRDWDTLRAETLAWTSVFAESSLDDEAVDHLAAQLSLLRSPTCFQTPDGRFFGFEGALGASTTMWSGQFGGSCPLNCTHVWNYEQTLAKTFPELERSMRETEFNIMQAPQGYIPHRVVSPVYLAQFWDEPIGGPEEPALDGMLGSVLKTYREYRHGAGEGWLRRYWPNVVRLLTHIRSRWDPTASGVLRGVQPSTHDIDLAGVNTFMGSLWLAALRAAEEMGRVVGDAALARELHELFELGSTAYDEALFNGEYYVQKLEADDPTDFQWVEGCLSDQVIGQWWAHELDLGYILPREHVVSALRAVVRHNLRTGFRDFANPYRIYADQDDTGLLMCSWPTGGRPEVPTRYADEVWSGVEYQVAAHCLREGLQEEGEAILSGLWKRHDGRRRNPYNEIECGDHYVRAMAGWSVLEALTGYQYDASTGAIRFRRGGGDSNWPFVGSTGWGSVSMTDSEVVLSGAGGEVNIASVRLAGFDWADGIVSLNGAAFSVSTSPPDEDAPAAQFSSAGAELLITLPDTVFLGAGDRLVVQRTRSRASIVNAEPARAELNRAILAAGEG